MKNNLFTADWENQLQTKLLSFSACSNTQVYICSPLNADSVMGVEMNMRAAKAYMYYASVMFNVCAKAPHAYIPFLLCDYIPEERNLALKIGMKMLERSRKILICGNTISDGMCGEIQRAAELGIDIEVYNIALFESVKRIIKNVNGDVGRICNAPWNIFLAMSAIDVSEYLKEKENSRVMSI